MNNNKKNSHFSLNEKELDKNIFKLINFLIFLLYYFLTYNCLLFFKNMLFFSISYQFEREVFFLGPIKVQ